ncbi:MAG: DUF5667 domain-containing protein [bacterium]
MKINNSQWKNVRMSDSEKSLIRARLVQSLHTAPVLSPYHPRHIFSSFGMVGKAVVAFSFIFVLVGGGSIANNALPGDILYPFKVGVIEEIKSSTYRTPAQKIVWQKTRVENRLKELETLSTNGDLTPENKILVENQINTQLTTLNEQMTVAKANPTQESKDAVIEVAKLEQTIEDHKEVLSTLTTNVEPAIETPTTLTAIASSTEIIKKEVVETPILKLSSTLQQITNTIEQAKTTAEEIDSVINGAPAHDIVSPEDFSQAVTTTATTTKK